MRTLDGIEMCECAPATDGVNAPGDRLAVAVVRAQGRAEGRAALAADVLEQLARRRTYLEVAHLEAIRERNAHDLWCTEARMSELDRTMQVVRETLSQNPSAPDLLARAAEGTFRGGGDL